MSNQQEEENVRLNRLYGFSIAAGFPLSGIHPIHQKHLPAVVEIRNIYRQVGAGAISSGKGEELVAGVIEHFTGEKRKALEDRSEKIKLLEAYSNFLEEHHYLDTDWRSEEPFAIDEFLKEK